MSGQFGTLAFLMGNLHTCRNFLSWPSWSKGDKPLFLGFSIINIPVYSYPWRTVCQFVGIFSTAGKGEGGGG